MIWVKKNHVQYLPGSNKDNIGDERRNDVWL